MIPTERLREDLKRVIDELGRAPTTAEYDERGDYSFLTVANRLGDGAWYEAIRAVGHEPATHVGSEIPEATLRADLERVVDEQEGTPTMAEYDDRGEFTAETVANRLGSGTWAEALATVDHEADASPRTIPDATLRADLERVIEELGRTPTMADYDARGRYSVKTISERFGDGSWIASLRTLGHTPETTAGRRIPAAELRADLERVIDELGRVPSRNEYDDRGTYAAVTLARRLGDGSWADAICSVGDDG